MAYPVSITVEPLLANRNRLTTAFRVILAIPHLFLVGGFGLSLAPNASAMRVSSEAGLLGAAAWLLAIVSWFTIVFTGQHATGIRQFTAFFMRWRARVLAYFMLLEDQYPPFGDMTYPAVFVSDDPTAPRDRLSVLLRLVFVIPHVIALCFVLFAWTITTIVAWFAILLTASYPQGLYAFGVGAFRWYIRVEAYMLLLVDEYPPFSLD